jgi:hypothetical protein
VTKNREVKNVEKFSMEGGLVKIWYYPNIHSITNDIIRLEPSIIHIIADRVLEIKEHEHRF